MSSFKRKGASKALSVPSYPGTRLSPASSSTIITSTGIPSLDDILGGGLPLSCSMLILAPDLHSSYGTVVQKYFVAEGLACGHRVVIVDGHPEEFVHDIMWYPKAWTAAVPKTEESDDEERTRGKDQKIKIAWRYEQMKQFQTSVKSSSLSSEDYCHTFDLSTHVPESVINAALQAEKLSYLVISRKDQYSTAEVLRRVSELLSAQEVSNAPIRICIPTLGSPFWGSLTAQDLSYFLHALRSLLRKHPLACASIGLPPHISTETWGSVGWRQKLGWLGDAVVSLAAFSADPSLSATFPSHHGIVHIDALPAPHMLVTPSDRFSSLRGLGASSSASGGGGENNLAFKCTRKRLVFETLHLDLDGGVSERRTTAPAASSGVMESVIVSGGDKDRKSDEGSLAGKMAMTKVDVCLEHDHSTIKIEKSADETKPKKKKKSVAFQSDRPDLYDF